MDEYTIVDRVKAVFRKHKTEMLIVFGLGVAAAWFSTTIF